MPFIILGTASELQIKVPTKGTTDWADTMRTDTFLKIAEHLHTGAGDGSQLGTGSLLADAVTGAKIRLDNDEYLRARNNADSANINVLKIDTSDDLYIDPDVSKLNIKNDTYITGRNNADSSDVNLIKVDTSDKLQVSPEISAAVKLSNNIALQHRNNADSSYISTINLNTSDKVVFGADINNPNVINDTYIKGRNNADSAYIDMVKVDSSDVVQVTAGVLNQHQSVTLTDNTSSDTTASIIDLDSNEAVAIHYKIIRSTDVASGVLELEESNKSITREELGDDVGVTFSLNATTADLEYTTTSTGNNATMTYIIIKK